MLLKLFRISKSLILSLKLRIVPLRLLLNLNLDKKRNMWEVDSVMLIKVLHLLLLLGRLTVTNLIVEIILCMMKRV